TFSEMGAEMSINLMGAPALFVIAPAGNPASAWDQGPGHGAGWRPARAGMTFHLRALRCFGDQVGHPDDLAGRGGTLGGQARDDRLHRLLGPDDGRLFALQD